MTKRARRLSGKIPSMTMTSRQVVVSGAPGTGKSFVAAALADGLCFPLLSLDMVKEALGDSLGLGEKRGPIGWVMPPQT